MAGARIQPGWALAGLTTLVVVAVVAASNFNEIYRSQKDFVAGSLLSLAGFCFGKALSRAQEERALALLRGPVAEALTRLERDLESGSDRVTDYYNELCSTMTHFRDMEILRVALDHLDKALCSASDLRAELKIRASSTRYAVDSKVRLALRTVARAHLEAINRRDQAYDWYSTRLADQDDASWGIFAVMTSDMVKSERMLRELIGTTVQSPPDEYLRLIDGYIHAAIQRAHEFLQFAALRGVVETPGVFTTMVDDLTAAIAALDRIQAAMSSGPDRARVRA